MKKCFKNLLWKLVVLIILIIVVYVFLRFVMPLRFDTKKNCVSDKTYITEKDGVYVYAYCMDNIRVKKLIGEVDLVSYINSNYKWYKKIRPLVSFPSNQGDYGVSYEGLNYKVLECKTKKNKNIYLSPLYGPVIDVDCKKKDEPKKGKVEGAIVEEVEQNEEE